MSSSNLSFYPSADPSPNYSDAFIACAMCDKKATQDCLLCHAHMYCGDECQNTHWVTHEKECNVVHTTASPSDVAFVVPFDLVDSSGYPVKVMHSITYHYPAATRQTEFLATSVGTLYDNAPEDVGRRGGWYSRLRQANQERRELKGTPSLNRPRLSKQGPNEGIGVGRRPNENELNGTATLTVKHWPSYTMKKQGMIAKSWDLTVAVRGHCFYRDAPGATIQKIMELRDGTATRPGLALWFNVDAFEQVAEMTVPTTGGYLEFTINMPGDTDQVSTRAILPNLRYLRSGFIKGAKRSGFGSGLTARDQLVAKGLSSDQDYILTFHDKRPGQGMRIQMTARMEDTIDMKIVDMEVYVPDGARTTQDTPYDTKSPIPPIQEEVICDISRQEDVDGLLIALRTEAALLAQQMEKRGDAVDASILESHTRVQSWMDTIAPHSVRLQAGGPAVEYGRDVGPLNKAVNESTAYLLTEGRLTYKQFGKGLKRKVRQARRRQYVRRMKAEGIGWAERKAQRWADEPSRLSNLREAVSQYQKMHLNPGDSQYDKAEQLIASIPVDGQ